MAGDLDRAFAATERLLSVRPDATVQSHGRFYAAPLAHNPACLENYLDGLRRAQLPEG